MTHPGLILYNATVRTLDPRQPVAELVALEGGRIAFVGSAGDLPNIRGPHTRLVDCQGGCLLPGFQDAHLHLLALASRLVAVDCSPNAAASIAQIKSALAQRAATTPRGAWIRGWAYDDWALEERRHPNRWDLDEAAPLHPVRLVHRSGHGTVLNSRALEAVGIGSETPDPPDGVIERGGHGEPTGLLLEMDAYLQGRIPRLAEHEMDNGLRMADALLLAHGVTLVQDATPSNDVERWGLLRRLKERGLPTPRVVLMPGAAALHSFAERGMGYGSGDERPPSWACQDHAHADHGRPGAVPRGAGGTGGERPQPGFSRRHPRRGVRSRLRGRSGHPVLRQRPGWTPGRTA